MRIKKINIVFLLAILFSIFYNINSIAATGWVYEGGNWKYYDKYESAVCNAWVKGNDGLSYYLDKSGNMVTDSWIEECYVNGNGVMLTNQWQKLRPASGDSFDDYKSQYWYYFGNNGSRIENSWKTINGKKYYFDSQGKMYSGWLNESYFFGDQDDGAMKTGWVKTLSIYDAEKGVEATDKNMNWYYFLTSGTLYIPDIDSGYSAATKKIDGATYAFDKDGKMLSGWANLSSTKNSSQISDYKYFGTANDGALKTGWQYVKAPSRVANSSDDEGYNWFYLSTKGVPKTGGTSGSYKKSDMVKIDGKSYLFDEYGRTLYGLQWIDSELYYLGTKDQCTIQTGIFYNLKQSNGVQTTFFFTTSGTSAGKGLTGVNDGYLYYKGKLQTAGSKEKFKVVSITIGGSNNNYVINTSGVVQKSATVTDGYGVVYKTNSKGILTYIYSEAIKASEAVGDDPSEAVVY